MQGQFFDATQFDPTQGGGPAHPVGKFPAYISATSIKPTRENDGQYLEVEFTTQAGKIVMRYNLWNNNPQAVDIAQRQLSALCYVTGVFKLDMAQQGAEFRNKQLQIEVRAQAAKPQYTEVGKVFDVQGNEPQSNKGGQQQQSQPQPQQQTQPPAGQQNGQPWNSQPAPQPQPPAGGQQQQPWQGGQQQQPQQQPGQQQAPWNASGGTAPNPQAPWNK